MKFLLLGTVGCHLCEEAETIINGCQQMKTGLQIEHIDIADHPEWQPDYAVRIPVLLHTASALSLDWPFTEQQVTHFFNIHVQQ